ncbi:MAG: DUF1292 domain-containing protein [Clostridia bacterium]|nr:DUF1292 domain-containing protein [Clostridia bacterium]
MNEELFTENGTYVLTDEDGKESEFEFIGKGEVDGKTYVALIPLEDNDEGCYVVLRLDKDENGEDVCVSIDDDDEFDRVAAYFDEKLIPEFDHDEDPGDGDGR